MREAFVEARTWVRTWTPLAWIGVFLRVLRMIETSSIVV